MGTMTSQTTSLLIVYSTFYSDADQRKCQSSTSPAFVNSPPKWPVTRKMFPFDDVIMYIPRRTAGSDWYHNYADVLASWKCILYDLWNCILMRKCLIHFDGMPVRGNVSYSVASVPLCCLMFWLVTRKFSSLHLRGLGSLRIPMLKSMLVNKDFQTWHLIGWLHSRQPIRSHVRKSLLTKIRFNP